MRFLKPPIILSLIYPDVVMPSTRSKKLSAATAAPSTPTPSQRKRKKPAWYESGPDPPPKKRQKKLRAPARRRRVGGSGGGGGRGGGGGAQALEPEASQLAAAVQAEDILGQTGGDDDDDSTMDDPQLDPEIDPEDEVAAFEEFEAVAHSVRYRAAIGTVVQSADAEHSKPVAEIFLASLWAWVDQVVEDMKPRNVAIVTLCATFYPSKQHKGDRRQKTIRRGDYSGWVSFQELTKRAIYKVDDLLNIDFDVILREERPALAPQAAPLPPRARPVTATIIQEQGLAGVLSTEQAATGQLLALKDQWRCSDTYCHNYRYQCWLPELGARVSCFENHHPMLSNYISNWLADIDNGLCTVRAPSN